MGIRFERLGETFAARIHGVDLARGIGAAEVEAIEEGLARNGVLVFEDQGIDDDAQQAFIQQFGPPHQAVLKEIASNHPHFYDIGTVDFEGNLREKDSIAELYMRANLLWHTDGAQNQPPIRLTALHARVLPPEPPPTEYADMHAAWEALAPDVQRSLEGLVVEHSIYRSREQMGMKMSDFSEESLRARKPVHHPLVRTNPRTGWKSLYLASHASHVVGWPLEKGRRLIDELIAHATQPRFVYSHAWSLHQLVMWDDSWTMHRATPYEGGHPRHLRWCAVRELEAV
ncbi:MAG: alpha-ketoglutarate-dependent 2,4-dichlorophenoxyacetate dioxygenase [Pseudomonadota bacterium]|jgi:alpha-ketoglutarate-dependent 2,4-dichlorophenoxyacetate dioxygenase